MGKVLARPARGLNNDSSAGSEGKPDEIWERRGKTQRETGRVNRPKRWGGGLKTNQEPTIESLPDSGAINFKRPRTQERVKINKTSCR